MTGPVSSEESWPTLAEMQLAHAWREPRLGHGPRAVVGDWRGALEAAERTRTVALMGLWELARTAIHEPDPMSGTAEQRAAWERAELARAEEASGNFELNAFTLIGILSALDALVETLVARLHEDLPEAVKKEKAPVPRDAGARRWEKPLAYVGLGAPTENPVTPSLDDALREAVSLRHALVHRAGRVGIRDRKDAPTLRLRYEEGALIRITRDDFRTYSAAVAAYGDAVVFRLLGPTLTHPVNLADWRNYALINT